MGKGTFVFLTITCVILAIALALLPPATSIKESLWIANQLWFTEYPKRHSHVAEASLEIAHDDYRTIGTTRIQALEAGVLLNTIQVFVPATFTYGGIEREVAIKLKGIRPTHWTNPIKWSFRIVVLKGGGNVEGMKIFSLQKPVQRGYYVDALYHQFLDKLNVINLSCSFVNLSLNGVDVGPYMIEEFFDSPILSRLNKPPGPILRFDYESFWKGVDWNDPEQPGRKDSMAATYHSAPIKSYKFRSGTYKGWKKDSKRGIALLDEFRLQEKSVKKTFNIKALANYFAVNTLLGNQHSALLTNLRFYYNPESKRLDPVGYDIEGIYSIEKDTYHEFTYWPTGDTEKRSEFLGQISSDSKFRRAYKEAMIEVTDSSFIEQVLSEFQPTYEIVSQLEPSSTDRRGLIWENAAAYRRHFSIVVSKGPAE